MADVLVFAGPYRFLSNFWPCTIIGPMGHSYPSVEHAYQASKCSRVEDHAIFFHDSAGIAKRRGRKVQMRADWDSVKLDVMEQLLRKKFAYRSALGIQLAEIDGKIEEGNSWHDTYWGVDRLTGEGFNNLGRLLMKLRDEMRYLDGKGDML